MAEQPFCLAKEEDSPPNNKKQITLHPRVTCLCSLRLLRVESKGDRLHIDSICTILKVLFHTHTQPTQPGVSHECVTLTSTGIPPLPLRAPWSVRKVGSSSYMYRLLARLLFCFFFVVLFWFGFLRHSHHMNIR